MHPAIKQRLHIFKVQVPLFHILGNKNLKIVDPYLLFFGDKRIRNLQKVDEINQVLQLRVQLHVLGLGFYILHNKKRFQCILGSFEFFVQIFLHFELGQEFLKVICHDVVHGQGNRGNCGFLGFDVDHVRVMIEVQRVVLSSTDFLGEDSNVKGQRQEVATSIFFTGITKKIIIEQSIRGFQGLCHLFSNNLIFSCFFDKVHQRLLDGLVECFFL